MPSKRTVVVMVLFTVCNFAMFQMWSNLSGRTEPPEPNRPATAIDAPLPPPVAAPSKRAPRAPAAAIPVLPEDEAEPPAPAAASFASYFDELLLADLGPVVSAAAYDPKTLPHVVHSATDDGSSLLGAIHEEFLMFTTPGHQARRPPMQATTTPEHLIFLKRTMSIAIGRIHRDAALHAMFDQATTRTARLAVAHQTRRAVRAMVTHMFIGLQLIIDLIDEHHPFKTTLKARQDWHEFDVDTDPLLLMIAAIRHTDGPSDVEKNQHRIEAKDFLREKIPAERTHPKAFARVQGLEYHQPHVNRASPGIGKLWNYFRPVTGCSSLTRTCEDPENCRLLCNAEYMTGAGETKMHHRIVGFGSNNQFGWEETTARLFAGRAAASGFLSRVLGGGGEKDRPQSAFNGLRSMTTLDCTVPNWQVPPYMARQNNFRVGRVCIDTQTHGDRIRIDALKALVVAGEAKTPGSGLELKGVDADLPPVTAAQRQLFDAVSIFKVDVEGHEHSLIPAWAKLELLDLKKTKGTALHSELGGGSGGSALTVIDFDQDLPSFFTVSLFQLEVHEKTDFQPSVYDVSALQGFRMQQYLASLGFMAVAHERNGNGDCCYEFIYVHYRYFIRSELWNPLHTK